MLVKINMLYQHYISRFKRQPECIELNRESYEKLRKELRCQSVDKIYCNINGIPVRISESLDEDFQFIPFLDA